MCIDYDAENWLGNPTREEMLEHHNKLIEAENELLRQEVDRYRANQAKLIEMLSSMRTERDRLAKDLTQANSAISSLRRDTYEQSRKLASYDAIITQRESVMRSHGIPEVYFGSPRGE
jgi:uncharacterized coiled-coil DUF342 family protein